MNARIWNIYPRSWGIVEPFRPEGGFGLRVAFGPFVRPVSFPWRTNPWSGWAWATMRLPFIILPFFSYRRWRLDGGSYFGLYLGGKTFGVKRGEAGKGHKWARPEDEGEIFVTWSATFRWRHGG